MESTRRSIAFCVVLTLNCASLPAWGAALEEVIVTAERRTESLQDVPVSVTNFQGDQVNEAGITGMADIAVRTPNLNLNTFNVGEPQLYLRGIGNTSDSVGSDPAVAVFIDDVYIGRPGAGSFDLYDLDRIEVLRGPQGTLYGKNVAGGVINIYTRKPSDEFEFKAGISAGSDSLIGINGFVTGPVGAGAAKLTVSHRSRDGFARNINTGQDLDDMENTSVRGQYRFAPGDRSEVLLGFDYSNDESNGECRFLDRIFAASPASSLASDASKVVQAAASAGLDERECAHAVRQSANKEVMGLLARLDTDFDWGTFTSISGFRTSELDWIQSLGGTEAPPALLSVVDSAEEEADQFSQEFRLSGSTDSVDWVTGIYYLKENAERSETFDTRFPNPPFAPFSGNVTFTQDNTTESLALFGQASWHVTDKLSLTLGGRWTRDEKDIDQAAFDNEDNGTPPAIPLGSGASFNPASPVGKPFSASGDESWSEFTPRFSTEWQVTNDHMLYFTASTGYKSGAFPSQATSPGVATSTIAPEQVTSFEVGAKTEWLDNRFRLNVAAFDMDYEDLQVFQLVNLQLVIANAAESSVRGLEADFQAAITDKFTVSGSFAVMDAEYNDYVFSNPNTGSVVNNNGNDMARAPEDSWNITFDYDIPVDNGAYVDMNLSVSHTGNYFTEPNNDPRSELGGYAVIDAFVRYTSAGEKWDVTAWGKNLGDKLYASHGILSTFGGVTTLWAPPRTYGLSINFRM